MTVPSRLRVVPAGGQGNLDTQSAVPTALEPKPKWLPFRTAAFELFARALSADESFHWQGIRTWSEHECERLQNVLVNCAGRAITVHFHEPITQSNTQISFGLCELLKGIEHVENVLRSELNGQEAKDAATQVFRFWVSMQRNLLDAAVSGSIKVYARVNSPLEPFQAIPADAFAHYEMIDWSKGVARCDGGPQLFSPFADLDDAGIASDKLSPTSADLLARRGRKRKTAPKTDFTEEFLLRNYPDGIPPGLTLKEIANEANEAYREEFGRTLSIPLHAETVRRVVKKLELDSADHQK